MDNITSLCQRFDEGVDSGAIRMTVDHDCGHAYNGWSGQLLDILEGLAENLSPEEYEEWEEHTNERLSEDDPGLYCVPEDINLLIKENGGKTPGNHSVVACDCLCFEDQCSTPEGKADYFQAFMYQLEEMDPQNSQHNRSWYRFDLMEAYIKATRK
jgi:hypothetical protein